MELFNKDLNNLNEYNFLSGLVSLPKNRTAKVFFLKVFSITQYSSRMLFCM